MHRGFVASAALLAACESFSGSSESSDAGATADAGSDVVAPAADGGGPMPVVPCGQLACAPKAGRPPSICNDFTTAPTGEFAFEPPSTFTIAGSFSATEGCNRGGAMLVDAPPRGGFTGDMFYADLGSNKVSTVHVAFDIRYTLDGMLPAGAYIDVMHITTAPRAQHLGSAALAVTSRVGDVFATIWEPQQDTASATTQISPGAWHHVVTKTTLGDNASMSVSVDGATPATVVSNLRITGNEVNGASVAFGRASNDDVPGIRVAFDNVRVDLE